VAVDLQCERFAEPLGVEEARPKLSWRLRGDGRGVRQGAYRVLVASSAEALAKDSGDLWDSGKVASDQSLFVRYAGKALTSRQRCWWKVAVWDAAGKGGAFSVPARWEMGLLSQRDWQGNWLAAGDPIAKDFHAEAPAPHFRRTFTLKEKPVAARVYICGLGYHELYANGRKMGDAVLEPAITRFDRRSLYVVHDVTDTLRAGENVLGAVLGTGLYDCFTKEVWEFVTAPWRDRPKMIAQLHLEFADGRQEVIVTDKQWKTSSAGPFVFNAMRNGEFYDARLEIPGWDSPGYDDRTWKPATVSPGAGGELRWQSMPPCRVMATLRPKRIWQPRPGVFVVDMGQAFSGWARIRPTGPVGTTVRLRYGEHVTSDGDLDQSNLTCFIKSGEFQTDRYTLKGEKGESWEPRFTYHGFQYVEVVGWPGELTLDDIDGRVVHTAFDTVGSFECSNDLINGIHHGAQWSTKCNYHGTPTDCPHREKCGWTGDASISAEQVLLNFDVAASYGKWMDDLCDAQRPSGQLPGIVPSPGWGYNWGGGPAWDSVMSHLPWYVYVYTGDTSLLEKYYEAMKLHQAYMDTLATNNVITFGLGDWCPPGGNPDGHPCPTAMTSTGYYYANARILADAAVVLGRKEDAATYDQQARQIRQTIMEKFFDARAGQSACRSQTGNAMLMFYGMLEGAQRDSALASLVTDIYAHDGHGFFGILGAKYVMQALTDNGRSDVAWLVATRERVPSWGAWIRQGATTLWEMWEGKTSRIHHMFSDIGGWFYKALAGINPDPSQPGFKRAIVRPYFAKGLNWVRAEHRSGYGTLAVAWKRTDGCGCGCDGAEVTLRVPPNTTAELTLPAADVAHVKESGKDLAKSADIKAKSADGATVIEVGSGEYVFTVTKM